MKSIVFDSPGKFRFEDRPKPQIKKPDDVLLKVRGIGICGTELHILHPDAIHPSIPGIILGHEYTATVEEVGSDVTEFKPGDTVIVDPHPACGRCEFCREDRPDRCTQLYYPAGHEFANHPITAGIFKDGAHTNYTVAPANSLYHISPDVPFEQAALAEPISCVACAVEKLHVKDGDVASILGAGPIGLLFVALLKMNGASKIIVSEPSEYRRQKALECGADIVVDPTKEDLKAVVMRETNDDGVDISVECVGDKFAVACDMARNGGKVLQFGHDEIATPKINIGQLVVRKDLEIHGAFIGKYMFKRTAELIESGKLPLDVIASHVIPLSKFQDALDLLRAQQALKVVIVPEEE
jgi:threonine dehydrogenase-like Zn-dependent dehydrogenase